MKKYLSMFAVAALVFVAVACGNSKDDKDSTKDSGKATQTEQNTNAATGTDLKSKAAAVAKKIEAGQATTEEDFVVMIDYVTNMTKEMKANPDKIKEIMDEYQYMSTFSASFDEWVNKADTLKPEIQQKLKDYFVEAQS